MKKLLPIAALVIAVLAAFSVTPVDSVSIAQELAVAIGLLAVYVLIP